MSPASKRKALFSIPVIVAALGYFVDIYDLLLFSIVRKPSLSSMGLSGDALMNDGIYLLNMQMTGLLIGGVLWGILGDKKGRLSVLFGSILLYSLANIANGFVQTIDQYAWLRLIAGIGLAGELGAGITLVVEVLPKEIRGYGTTLVATIGLLGAVLAYYIAEHLDWRTAYFIGGGLGLLLLLLRVSIFESGMFEKLKTEKVSRGNMLMLFNNPSRFMKYLRCILIGVPIWYAIGILITFSPELAKALGVLGEISSGKAVMISYLGLAAGDLSSGIISQWLRSRKRVVMFYMLLTLVFVLIYLIYTPQTLDGFYWICFALGLSVGYWALFVTVAAEQFGTNIRATVTTSVPNFVRGTVVPVTLLFNYWKESYGLINSALYVGLLTLLVGFIALYFMEETYHKDLDYLEK